MINPERVSTMTKLAIMEEQEGRELMKLCSYRKIDYVLTEIFKAFVSGTVVYLLGLILWFFYLWDSLNDFIVGLNVEGLLLDIGFRYIIFMAIYITICAIIAFRRHTKRMGQRYIYLNYLKSLRNSYDSDRKARVYRAGRREEKDRKRRKREDV